MNEDQRRTYARERELVELIILGGLGRKPAEEVANKIASAHT